MQATTAGGVNLSWGNANPVGGRTSVVFSLWLNVASWGASYQGIWLKDDYPTQNAGWCIQRNSTLDQIQVAMRGSGTNNTIQAGTGWAGTGWNHLGVVITTVGVFVSYKNGAQQGSSAGISNPFGNTGNPQQLQAGDNNIALADAVIFNCDPLTSGQMGTLVSNLAAGQHPLTVPLPRLFYAPLYGGGPCEPDLSGFCGYSDCHGNINRVNGPKWADLGDVYKDSQIHTLPIPAWAPQSAARRARMVGLAAAAVSLAPKYLSPAAILTAGAG